AAIEGDRAVAERCKIKSAGDDIGLERERAAPRLVEPDIDAGEIASRHRRPGERGAGTGLHDLPFRVEEVHRRKTPNAIALKRQFSLPHRLATAAAILRSLPGDAHAGSEIGSREGTRRLHDLGTVQHIEAFDRGGPDDLGGKPHRRRAGYTVSAEATPSRHYDRVTRNGNRRAYPQRIA